MLSLPAPLCLVSLLLPALGLAAPVSPAEPIRQAYSLALYMQKNTSTLLHTYVSDSGLSRGLGETDQTLKPPVIPGCAITAHFTC